MTHSVREAIEKLEREHPNEPLNTCAVAVLIAVVQAHHDALNRLAYEVKRLEGRLEVYDALKAPKDGTL